MGISMAHIGLRHALARALGEKQTLERKRATAQAQLANLQSALAAIEAGIARADNEVMTLNAALEQAFADSAADVSPRQTVPKKHVAPWGGVTRTILAMFRAANGGPLRKSEIMAQLQTAFYLSYESAPARRGFSIYVQRTLNNMTRYGYLERLHDPKSGREGQWRLKASSE